MNRLKHSLLLMAVATFLFTSCSKKETVSPNPIQDKEPIVLDCDYFHENRTLTKDPQRAVDYVITCVMKVYADIVIEPGVVIEFEQDAGIVTDDFNIPKASLSAVGTSDKPIVFRGVKKEKGYWRGFMFSSNNPDNKLIHTRVEDAGGKAFNSNGDLGAVILYADSRLVMENTTISNSKSNGFNANYGQSAIILNNNKFKNNDVPVLVSPAYINAINNTNDYSGNTKDFVIVYNYTQSINTPSTWHKINVPYSVPSTQVKNIVVKNLLTIEPGVVIEFGAETALNIHEDGGGIKAIGTSDNPIIFTGISKVPKAWIGIYINSAHPENEIAHAEFRYSGIPTSQSPKTGTVRVWYNDLINIHDVVFKNHTGCGIVYGVFPGGGGDQNVTIGPNIDVDAGGCISSTF